MQAIQLPEAQRAWITGAVVFRGSAEHVERLLEELRGRRDVRVVYVRTGATRLRIVPEGP